MLQQSTRFLNPDGTVSREWWLFLQTLEKAIGGPSTTIGNVQSVSDAMDLIRVEDELGIDDDVAAISARMTSIEVVDFLDEQPIPSTMDTLLNDLTDDQALILSQDSLLTDLIDDIPAGFATKSDSLVNNVMIWMDM